MSIYLDNAATTPIDEKVFEAMKPHLMNNFGNPSSIHSHGREARSVVEMARKTIADLLNTSPSEIFFTSGGTEADNLALTSAVETYGYKHIISSRIEHHAVLHTIDYLEKNKDVSVSYVDLESNGHLNYIHLETLLNDHPNSLVSLMHGNNEIGNLNDIERIGELCNEHSSFFHSDTVQTVAHFPIDLDKINIQSINASAHKFHGPKGSGFIFIRNEKKLNPMLHGGGQERNMRGGTENVAGIVGLATAMQMGYDQLEKHKKHILQLKNHCLRELKSVIPGIVCHGDCSNNDKSLYTVLNIGIPNVTENDMLLFNLDINGISASGGSACTSGSSIGSHVLEALQVDQSFGTIRISFSKMNTLEEVDFAVEKLKEIIIVGA